LLDVHGHAPAHRLGVVPGAPEQQQRHQPKHQRSLARALFNGQCLRLAGNAPASAASSPRRQSALPWPQHTGRKDGPVGLEHDHQQCDRGHQEVKDGDDHGDAPYGRTGVGLLKPAAQPAGPGPANRLPRRTGRSAPRTAGLRHRLSASRHSLSSGRAGCDQEYTGRQREEAQESAAIKVHPALSLSAV
jgi:hypothetical protein